MSKIIKITAFVVFLALLLVSCAQQSDTEVFDEALSEFEGGGYDLSGKTFSFGSHWIEEYELELGYSDSGDKMLARYKDVREHFGITFNLLDTTHCEASKILGYAASGYYEEIPDVMDVAGDQAYSMYKSGMLFPFDEMTTIDINDSKFGNVNFIATGSSWGGHRWAIYPYNWQMIPQYIGTVIFNNSNLRQYGHSNEPYELIENGGWTWSNYRKILEDLQTQNPEETPMTFDQFHWLCQTAVLSNGGQIVDESKEVPTLALGSSKATAALEWVADLYANKLARPFGSDYYSLTNGTTFCYDQSYHATLVETEDSYCLSLEDYGLVPFPWGPSGEYGSCTSLIHTNRRFICANALSGNDMDEVGIVIDYLFEPLDGDEKEAWKNTLNYTLLHEEDVKNYIWMCENVTFLHECDFGSMSSKINEGLKSVVMGSSSVSEFIESVETATNTNLEENHTEQSK